LVPILTGCSRTSDALPIPVRFAAAVPEGRRLDTFAISADGRWLAYSAETATDSRRRLFVRGLLEGTQADRELQGTAGATHSFFSPDSHSIAYFSQGAVWRVPVAGDGKPVRITSAPTESAGGTWTEDGRIIVAPLGNEGLLQIPASGGVREVLTTLNTREGEIEHAWPHAIPGGAVVFTVSERGRDPHLEILSSDGKRTRLRVPAVGQSQFVETGHLVYGYLGQLMIVPFDTDQLQIRGVPVPAAKGLQSGRGAGAQGRSGFAVSQTGTLIWLRSSTEDSTSHLVRVARDGRYESLSAPPDAYQTPRVSPDGRRLAVVVRPDVMTREIRVLDAARPVRVLFTLRGGDNQAPAWMDNRRLTFGSNRDGVQKIYVASGTGAVAPLFTANATAARNPAAWIRSPQLLALYEIDPIRRRDVLVYRVGESIAPVAATNANERSPALSPDGKWVAYVSDASGKDQVYIKPLDGSLEALQMTSAGATEPVWTREGLFYREGDRMMLVSLDAGAPGALRQIFEGRFERDPGVNLPAYDLDRRGNFIMLKSALVPRELRVVQNWGTELVKYFGQR
jgi:serine/threonine-protein kinase